MKDYIVIDFAHEIHACVLGQASASLLASHIIGQTIQDLKILRKVIYQMLTQNGPSPQAPFEDFSCLQPIKNYKMRHAATLLPFDATIDCIQQIEEKEENKCSTHSFDKKTSRNYTGTWEKHLDDYWAFFNTFLSNNTFEFYRQPVSPCPNLFRIYI